MPACAGAGNGAGRLSDNWNEIPMLRSSEKDGCRLSSEGSLDLADRGRHSSGASGRCPQVRIFGEFPLRSKTSFRGPAFANSSCAPELRSTGRALLLHLPTPVRGEQTFQRGKSRAGSRFGIWAKNAKKVDVVFSTRTGLHRRRWHRD